MTISPIYNNLQSSGLGNQASYQVSSKPYLSSSIQVPLLGETPAVIEFPNVTKTITIRNDGVPDLRWGFSSNGVSGTVATQQNFGTLAQDSSFSGDYRVIRLYLLSDSATEATASVIAGMTGISVSELPNNWSGSAGVG